MILISEPDESFSEEDFDTWLGEQVAQGHRFTDEDMRHYHYLLCQAPEEAQYTKVGYTTSYFTL